jgi:hypothetical protein
MGGERDKFSPVKRRPLQAISMGRQASEILIFDLGVRIRLPVEGSNRSDCSRVGPNSSGDYPSGKETRPKSQT